MSIAKAVREYLTTHGIRQSHIAEVCGWSKQKTSAIINGRKRMTAEELAAISDALQLPYDYFYIAAGYCGNHISEAS